MKDITFIDLFAGIGGIRLAFENAGFTHVWGNDVDKFAHQTYVKNFGDYNHTLRDIREVLSRDIPNFDILCAGFPCQPFSASGIATKKYLGKEHGFQDETSGTLFYDILRIMDEKRPKAFFLENVKGLKTHDKGNTFKVIQSSIESLGYSFFSVVINSSLLVPQNRPRTYIVGFSDPSISFDFPNICSIERTVGEILESNVDAKYILSDKLWQWLQSHAEKHRAKGNGFGFSIVNENSHARTLSARYHKDGSEILIATDKNPRKLTPRECARLQGFPDSFSIPVSNTQAYKQFGNSVSVPIVEEVAKAIKKVLK